MPYKIYKYNLTLESERNLPNGSRVLKVDLQRNALCLWALVDTEIRETSKIEVLYTGDTLQESSKKEHLGTFLLEKDTLVVHIFKFKYL